MKRLPRTTWSRGLCWLWGPTQIILGGRLHTRRRRDPVNTRLPAKPDRLGECAARCGIAGRDHGIIGGQIPFGAVFVRGEPETVHQVAFQRLELPAIFQADEIVRLDGEADRKSTRLNSSHSCASRMPSSV